MMIDEGNTTHELIAIPTKDGVKTIHPAVLKAKLDEAFDILDKETAAKSEFKELVEEIVEANDIPKGIISKWFKARYKAKVKDALELGKAFEAMDDAVPEPQSAVQ